MHANNEINAVNDVAAVGACARAAGAFFHCDASQACGKLAIDVERMQIDLLSLSAHKIYGPKGVGALYCRRRDPRVRLVPQLHGGGHERGFRSGTLNVPGIVGLGRAAELAESEREAEVPRLERLTEQFCTELQDQGVTFEFNGMPTRGLPGLLSLTFADVEADDLLLAVPGIAMSKGAACTSSVPRPSHVLRAIGCSAAEAERTLRLGVGRFTDEEAVRRAAVRLGEAVRTLRGSGGDKQPPSAGVP
jgi:cysteine desulfurase